MPHPEGEPGVAGLVSEANLVVQNQWASGFQADLTVDYIDSVTIGLVAIEEVQDDPVVALEFRRRPGDPGRRLPAGHLHR